MNTIIPLLLVHIQVLNNQIKYLLIFIAKNIRLKSKPSDWNSPKYNKLKIDKLPLVKVPEKKNYKELIAQHLVNTGKILRPILRRKESSIPSELRCPCCNAPSEYIYDNTGGRGQFECKVCSSIFNKVNRIDNPIELRCPYCNTGLLLKHKRKNFNVHVCNNKKCSYFSSNLKALSCDNLEEYRSNPSKFKLHYIYREFTTNFFKVDLLSLPDGASSLAFRKFTPHIMGLSLTYLINCGLSTRQTRDVLKEVHNVNISHSQIANYATTAAFCVKAFVDNFDYKPSKYLAADETYTKLKGIKQYVWFIIDAMTRSILGYRVSLSRDVGPCILAMRMAFAKFKIFPGKALKFVADGYTAYLLAAQQFALHRMPFDVTQVIGLTNDDPVSKEYRWLKQIIERLNRTFKHSYRITNGYGSEDGANTHVVLFVAYYNFLRPHSFSFWKPLNYVPEIDNCPNMPAKWVTLIQLSQQILLSKQIT